MMSLRKKKKGRWRRRRKGTLQQMVDYKAADEKIIKFRREGVMINS